MVAEVDEDGEDRGSTWVGGIDIFEVKLARRPGLVNSRRSFPPAGWKLPLSFTRIRDWVKLGNLGLVFLRRSE